MNLKYFGSFALLTVLFISASVSAVSTDPKPRVRRAVAGDNMKFTYENYGIAQSRRGMTTSCDHRLASPGNPYDWKVRCYDGNSLIGEYTAHVAITVYERPTQPRVSVELLYWLTSGTNLPSEVGSTTWMHFNSPTGLSGILTSQTIEKGTAGLYLEFNPLEGLKRKIRR